jgi:preprotein translocase subunit SecA
VTTALPAGAFAAAPQDGADWNAPRVAAPAPGARWSDWGRRARHASGRIGRDLREDARAADQLRILMRDWDEVRLDNCLVDSRAVLRLGGRDRARLRRARIEGLACTALAAERVLGQAPYPVQLLAAVAMHEGLLVQMSAGEGKTLAVALAGILHGWRGLPCHVVTANEYLAQRDAAVMEPLYLRCGVTVTSAVHGMDIEALRRAYAGDVVYATSKQLLADHLFDRIMLEGATDAVRRRVRGLSGEGAAIRSRGLHTAIVDEADSVLIDEANTPLIISAAQPNPLLVSAVLVAREIADGLEAGRDYRVDLRFREIDLTERGRSLLESLVERLPPVWHAPERRDDLICQALSARELYRRDRDYIVEGGKIEILDENTGRVLAGRSWSFGLHQAIEAREGLEITHPSRTLARMSFQEFFRHYHRLCGASGTLQGVRGELWRTYGLLTFRVPERLPSRLLVHTPAHHADAASKWQALIERILLLNRQGLPVLVGTRRLSDTETLQSRLRACGLDCTVLNAKQHEHEARIIAEAGQPGRITVATNMAGRGADIPIGPQVALAGGLQVLMLEPHESVRVDWQLFGRAGRQGQPGSAQAFVALDDDLLRRHLPFWAAPLRYVLGRQSLARGLLIGVLIGWAQRAAQARAFRGRRRLQERERELRRQLSFTSTGVQ